VQYRSTVIRIVDMNNVYGESHTNGNFLTAVNTIIRLQKKKKKKMGIGIIIIFPCDDQGYLKTRCAIMQNRCGVCANVNRSVNDCKIPVPPLPSAVLLGDSILALILYKKKKDI
jgi:hypothetical protein